MKVHGEPNRLLERIADDPRFAAVHGEVTELLDATRFIGRSPEQVDEFLADEVQPRIAGVDASDIGVDVRV